LPSKPFKQLFSGVFYYFNGVYVWYLDKNTVNVVKMTKIGNMIPQNWKLGVEVSENEMPNLLIDDRQIYSPTYLKMGDFAIFQPARTFIYHGMNPVGNTAKTKVVLSDYLIQF
jgi:hypothetical protein